MNDQLDSALIRSVDYVHCVGHSLGGAVANLVALQASKITGKKNVCLYTFGAPRVGLEVAGYHRVACRLLGEDNIFRISHDLDPVPMVCLPPYQHVHPSILAKQNFLLRSPFDALSIDNHDTGQYIASCVNKSWTGLGAAPLTQLEIDRQFFQKWINDDSWIKNKLGMTGNIVLGTLIKIVKGLVARSVMFAGMGIASAIDLIAITVDKGVKLLSGVSEFAIKLISEIAKAFGIVVQESKSFLMGLLAKMKAHITVLTKRAMIKASKLSQSREFQSILEGAQSIGLILM